jgi:hypothetical protein
MLRRSGVCPRTAAAAVGPRRRPLAGVIIGIVLTVGTLGTTSAGAMGLPSGQPSAPIGSVCHHMILPAWAHCTNAYPSVVTLVPNAPTGVFADGQIVTVMVGPNSILQPGRRVTIRECAAPSGRPWSSMWQCDSKTVQQFRLFAGRHGTVVAHGYPIFALPDATTLGEPPKGVPVCNLSHPCVLLVSEGPSCSTGPHVWSLPFSVTPLPNGSGGDPGNGLPEVPYTLVLPILGFAVVGSVLVIRRRRSAHSGSA